MASNPLRDALFLWKFKSKRMIRFARACCQACAAKKFMPLMSEDDRAAVVTLATIEEVEKVYEAKKKT